MNGPKALLLAPFALACFLAGCMEPSVYQGYGTTPPPKEPPRTVTSAPTPAKPGSEALPGIPKDLGLGPSSPDNVAIVVEKVDSNTLAATNLSSSIAYSGDRASVRAGGGPLVSRNGLRIGIASDDFRARLGGVAAHRRDSFRQQMFITVLSGQEGAIVVGDDVFVQRLGFWGPDGYVLLVERAFVGRSLAVRPRIQGNGMIEVELWPRFTTRQGRVINLTQLAATVVVRNGQPIVIGGLSSSGTDVGSVLFASSSRSQTTSMTLILTAKTGGMTLDWPGMK